MNEKYETPKAIGVNLFSKNHLDRCHGPSEKHVVGYQSDDEPNLYIGNGWKSPNIHFKLVGLGVPGINQDQ